MASTEKKFRHPVKLSDKERTILECFYCHDVVSLPKTVHPPMRQLS